MSEQERHPADDLLRAMASSGVPVAGENRERDARIVREIEREIASEARRRSQRKAFFRSSAVALAAAAILAVGAVSFRLGHDDGERSAAVAHRASLDVKESTGNVVVLDAKGHRLLEDGKKASIASGEGIETLADGRARLETDHSQYRLSASTHLELIGAGPAGERVKLAQGKIDVDVRHSRERNVVVETPDVEVLVVGTAFSVSVEPGSRGTSVSVSRGTVWVVSGGERRSVLTAGQTFSSRELQASEVVGSASAGGAATPANEGVEPRPAAGSSSSAAQGTLAEENRVYQSALEARNGGNDALALELFVDLLRRFPRSVHAEEASINRFRALSRLGRTGEATLQAKRYLSNYPRGHARDEATTIAGQ